MRFLMVVFIMMFSFSALTCWGDDYLYTPQKVTGTTAAEGVLVREIVVKKGDTLSHISKKYAGRGHYYPQILLFNKIRNPHRISKGQVVRVPLYKEQETQRPAVAAEPGSAVSADAGRSVALTVKEEPPVIMSLEKQQNLQSEKDRLAKQSVGRTEKRAYQKAVAAYKKGDYEHALKSFDSFIKNYPKSSLLSEATLNRAECYLRMSTK